MTVPVLPDPPSRSDPATFSSRADAFFDALEDFSAECNLLGTALDTAVDTVTGGLAASTWVSAGSYTAGDRRYSPATGLLYRAISTHSGRTTDPSTDTTYWARMANPHPTLVIVSGTTHTAAANTAPALTSASQTVVTLPASPSVGDVVEVYVCNGRLDNQVARNGQDIDNVADDVQLDLTGRWVFRYVSAAWGWSMSR